jgi:uncharacterized membrane protein
MPDYIPLFLYLHILGAIVAFGPTFTLPYLAARAGREPQHANFMVRASVAVSKGIILPVALSMAVTGGLLIWSLDIDPLDSTHRWLLLAIVLYVIAVGFSAFVQLPNGQRVVELTSTPPPPGATGGPPPELSARIQRARLGSILLMLLVVAIAFLMVTKPEFGI